MFFFKVTYNPIDPAARLECTTKKVFKQIENGNPRICELIFNMMISAKNKSESFCVVLGQRRIWSLEEIYAGAGEMLRGEYNFRLSLWLFKLGTMHKLCNEMYSIESWKFCDFKILFKIFWSPLKNSFSLEADMLSKGSPIARPKNVLFVLAPVGNVFTLGQ